MSASFPSLFCLALLLATTPAGKGSAGDITLQDIAGTEVKPLNIAERTITVFIFVRTDCPISNRYAPEIKRLAEQYQSKGVRLWLVYPNADESSGAIQAHLKEYNLGHSALRDPQHSLVKLSKVKTTPEAAVFRGETLLYHGRIDNQFADFGKARPEATSHELRDAINALLAGKTPAVRSAPAIGCFISDLK